MEKIKDLEFSTKAIHTGYTGDATGAVMPPIYLSTTFKQSAPGKPVGDFEYSRSSNPNRVYLEKTLAALENGRHGLCFASGCAALMTLLQTLPQHAHVLVSDDVYGGTYRLFANVFSEKNIQYTQVDFTDLVAVKDAIQSSTQLIWIETPSNPMLKIIDIQAISDIKKQLNPCAYLFVDNTFATPYLQTPLLLGADGVCHSTTKYIGGHSDVVGGALIVNDDALHERLQYFQNALGAIPSSMDCYLLLRSIKTLALRMQAHGQHAQEVVDYLAKQSSVIKIYYPGLESHLNHLVAKQQMRGFGGMISVLFDYNLSQIQEFLSHLRLFTLAESLGGVESLVEHPAIMTHATLGPEQRKSLGIDDGLLRFSIGLENPNDLIHDLDQSIKKL